MTNISFKEEIDLPATADMNVSEGDHQPKDETDMEKPAITDLQAAAKEFNAAFSTALYELESSRRIAVESSNKIDELNESIKNINNALTNEISKGHRIEEEYCLEKEQLNQNIREIESARNDANQQVCEHENTLNARAEEISQLSSLIEDLTGTLEQRAVDIQHLQEEFSQERDMLTGELNEQKELLDKANNQLNAQRQKLADSDKEAADINEQINRLTNELHSRTVASEQQKQEYKQETTKLGTEILELNEDLHSKDKLLEQHCNELESKVNEVVALNEHINELKDEVNIQAASIQEQSESHTSTCKALESRISDISGELESMHTAQNELGAHSEKLENLNRALHESSISENDLHKAVLEDKDSIIKSLRTKLTAANDTFNEQADSPSLAADLHSESHDLESRLKEVETLQDQVTDLQSELESSRSEQQSQIDKLREYEALKQEVINLRETVRQDGKTDVSSMVNTLRDEAESLKSALSASEEKRKQLQNELSSAQEQGSTNTICQPPATQDPQPIAETADRCRFVSHLNTLLTEQTGSDTDHTVMYILLDNFIRIRDEIGIINSEHVINEISEIIASFCDDNDTTSRFGDCTFAILSCNAITDETQKKAEKIRAAVEHHIFEISGHSMIASTSIGICRVRGSDTSAEEIISRADLSCEAARSSGGNKVMVNSAEADEIIITGSNANHEEIISATLAENRMMIYYQPISSLKETPGNYFEILVRIIDGNGNSIMPGEFFSMAETTGQCVDIDFYVIEKVMQMMAENRDKEMRPFIKLTRQSVADHDFPLWVIGKIKEYNVNPEQLVFEIAETTLQSNLKNLSMLSTALKAIGCKIAIEHYRMSSQPQHLLHIHTDYLKIDSSLVEDISRKGKSLEKVTAIMELATKNNYITIAEGVENPASLAILWELGVSFAQGYFIQAPAGSLDFNSQDIDSENKAEKGNKSTYTIG